MLAVMVSGKKVMGQINFGDLVTRRRDGQGDFDCRSGAKFDDHSGRNVSPGDYCAVTLTIYPVESMSRTWLRNHLLPLVLAVALTGAPSLGQELAPFQQVIAVRHLPVDVAARRMETAAQAAGLRISVLVSPKDKTLLLQGAEGDCVRAAELWTNLDKPLENNAKVLLTTKPDGAATTESVSHTHQLARLPPRELEAALIKAWLRISFKPQAGEEIVTTKLPGDPNGTISIDRNRGTVTISGGAKSVNAWRKVVEAMDAKPQQGEDTPTLVPLNQSDPAKVEQAIGLLKALQKAGGLGTPKPMQFVAQDQPVVPAGEQPAKPAGEAPPATAESAIVGGDAPIGPVTIEILDELGIIIIRGKKRDVERVQKIIQEIEDQSALTAPEIEIFPLRHIDGRAVSDLIASIYDQVFGARSARVSITPLVKPNALLLIGRKENVAAVKELLHKLDQPAAPQAQLKVFPLKYISAVDAERTVRNFFVSRAPGTDERTGLGTRLNVVAEVRSNALVVQASPRDLLELGELLKRIDVKSVESKKEVRVFKLRNSLAEELAPVLTQAITGRSATGGGQGAIPQATGGQTNAQPTPRNASLQLLQIDPEGRRILESGILSDVTIAPDTRGNALVVTASPDSMDLIAALIEQLDGLPNASAQIKVFTLVNADAQTVVTALQQLFGQSTNQQGGQGQLPLQSATGAGESTLVPLRFSVDQRTNSVISSGNAGDLEVVERILFRLDEGDIRRRKTTVYRLRNAPAVDVATAINQLLQSQRQVSQLAPGATSAVEQIEREVVVVPERVSNSLLVSATPRYYEEIRLIVDDLDRRPPMVVIQVMIAEVRLDNTNEFGVEFGLQDSLLFDRGIGTVGFPFVGQALGNNSTPQSLATRNNVGTQGTSSFAVGRTNGDLGYGGLTLSASSDAVSILVRALQRSQRLQVISRPQVQTLDNQPAFVQVGSRVPYVTSSNQTVSGIQNQVSFQNVGILLGVTPRTSPDGLIVMEINAEKSELGPEATGVPTFISSTGEVIRSPVIFITTAQTTVSARTGQTVILGGLITKNRTQETRRVPYISDVPVLGRLFRFDRQVDQKSELLIIMTPYVVRTDEDIEWINSRETARMNWCLADVADAHGEVPWAGGEGAWNEKKTPLIFPDEDPTGTGTEKPEAGKIEYRDVPPGARRENLAPEQPKPADAPRLEIEAVPEPPEPMPPRRN